MPRKRVLNPDVLPAGVFPANPAEERSLPLPAPPRQGEDRSLPVVSQDALRELVEDFSPSKTAATQRAYKKDLEDFRMFLMAKVACFIEMLFVLALPSFAGDFTFRDRSGRVIETWTRRGATVDVRDRTGRLQETWTRNRGQIQIRDRSGRLLGTKGK